MAAQFLFSVLLKDFVITPEEGRAGINALVSMETRELKRFRTEFKARLEEKIRELDPAGQKVPSRQVLFQMMIEPTAGALLETLQEAGIRIAADQNQVLLERLQKALAEILPAANEVMVMAEGVDEMNKFEDQWNEDTKTVLEEIPELVSKAVGQSPAVGKPVSPARMISHIDSASPQDLEIYWMALGLDTRLQPNGELFVYLIRGNKEHEKARAQIEAKMRELLAQGKTLRVKFVSLATPDLVQTEMAGAYQAAIVKKQASIILTPQRIAKPVRQILDSRNRVPVEAVRDLMNRITPALAVALARVQTPEEAEALIHRLPDLGIEMQSGAFGITVTWNIQVLLRFITAEAAARAQLRQAA